MKVGMNMVDTAISGQVVVGERVPPTWFGHLPEYPPGSTALACQLWRQLYGSTGVDSTRRSWTAVI